MFHETFQSGFLSIFFSIGSNPLEIWNTAIQNGSIRRISDEDIQSSVLEISGSNVATTYMTCPAMPDKTLGIKLPYFVLVLKNLKKYFSFEIQVLDDKHIKRRFRASNYQSTTRVKPFICTMPMRLDEGWNQVQVNLADFVRKAYGTNYIETLRVQIHANCRLRRLYFAEKLYPEAELPPEFKLYSPLQPPNSTTEELPGQTGLDPLMPQFLSPIPKHERIANPVQISNEGYSGQSSYLHQYLENPLSMSSSHKSRNVIIDEGD